MTPKKRKVLSVSENSPDPFIGLWRWFHVVTDPSAGEGDVLNAPEIPAVGSFSPKVHGNAARRHARQLGEMLWEVEVEYS